MNAYRSLKFDMKKKEFCTKVLALAVSLCAMTASAQMPGSGGGGASTVMIKLFPDTPAFTGKASVRVVDPKSAELMHMPSTFTILDGKLRVDVDWGLISSKQLNPAVVPTLRKAGLDHLSSVMRPDKKAMYLIYPAAQSYASIPLSVEDSDLAGLKLTRTPLGRETVDKHPCVKNHSVVKDQKNGTVFDGTTWNATDMQNFPLQIQMKESGNTTTIHFQQVSFTRPDANLFNEPAGYKRFTETRALEAAALNKAAGAQKK